MLHDRTDGLFSALDLTDLYDFRRFLQAHAAVYAGLSEALGATAPAGLDHSLAALRADLKTSGASAPTAAGLTGCDRLAAEYILRGSRLGLAVLRRRWLDATHPQVRAAHRFVSQPVDGSGWRRFCAGLGQRPATGCEADRAVADAEALFVAMNEALAITEYADVRT